MSIDLKKYLPRLYDGVYETDRIMDVENHVFGRYQEERKRAERNQYILTADLQGIENFEKIYDLSGEGLDTEFRRERLISRTGMSLPYTLPFLRKQLDLILGEGEYKLKVRSDQYKVQVVMTGYDLDRQLEANALMMRIVPCNMVIDIKAVVPDEVSATVYVAAALGEYIVERFGGNK